MSASEPTRAVYLQGDGAPFFAVLHEPAGPPRPAAVLLCPPFGWEDMCAYRIRREWAQRLALDGYRTLRIDLPGSGDSAGVPTDPDRIQAWTQAAHEAARWLRQPDADGRNRTQEVAALGIGLGGFVLCRAALQGAPIGQLVLWSVPARGRALARELRACAALELAAGGSGRPADGHVGVVANGYLLSAQTMMELERLDLGSLDARAPSLRRALLLGRDGLRVDAALGEALERAGAEVTVAEGPGYGAMMPAEPLDARAPAQVEQLVSSWLATGQAPRQPPSPAPAAAAKAPSALEAIVLEREGMRLRERPLSFEVPGGRVFGVLTEPLGTHSGLTAVLSNAGIQRRIGPNRMWVEIARRWAAKGVATLRMDAAGIGDFEGEDFAPAHITDFYRPLYVEQMCAALDELARLGLPQRYLTLGFCSGAYCSAQAALVDERVAAVLMINPRTLVFDEWQWRHTLQRVPHIRERMLLPSTWGKVLRGEIGLDKHLETGRTLVRRAASAPIRARRRITAPRDGRQPRAEELVEGLFDALRERDQRVLLMFTGKEVLHRELAQKGVLDDLGRWPNLELSLLDTGDDAHTLTPLWVQSHVHELVDRVLEEELGRAPYAAAGSIA